ncbi:MAG: hypothetical protein JRJ31_04930 [Deltaproteobacteria bacterium]|nr:hypothetical protein [Deltaproteobacteria bacterium]
MLAKHSNHGDKVTFRTDADAKRYLAQRSIDFQTLVGQYRNFNESVPYFENLVGSIWSISPGAKVGLVDRQTGEKKFEVHGPGTISMSTYWAHFETAWKARNNAVERISFPELQVAIVYGVACIEAYINHRVELWNRDNAQDRLIDSPTNKVRFDDKIDVWIPKMTGGKKLDKSAPNWMHFQELRKVRDHLSIHPKSVGFDSSFWELAEKINNFRTGIAGFLIQLHVLFNERIPAIIIRAFYAPEVEVVEVNL